MKLKPFGDGHLRMVVMDHVKPKTVDVIPFSAAARELNVQSSIITRMIKEDKLDYVEPVIPVPLLGRPFNLIVVNGKYQAALKTRKSKQRKQKT